MTKYRKGDRVRVVLEDSVRDAWTDGQDQRLVLGPFGEGNIINVGAEHVTSVEFVKRRKPQVGDLIGSRAELADLPVKTVVVNEYGDPLLCLAGGTQGNGSYRLPYLEGWDNAPYRVVYVPE